MTTPTPRDVLVDAIADAIHEDLADEAQWSEAVSYALNVAVRDHLPALLALCGDVHEAVFADASDPPYMDRCASIDSDPSSDDYETNPCFVVVPRVSEDATDAGRHVPFGVDDSNDIAEFYRGEAALRERESEEAHDA